MSTLLAVFEKELFFSTDDGESFAPATPELRFLHLEPTLYLTHEQSVALGRRKAALSVTCAGTGVAGVAELVLVPRSGIKVRRAYPNRHYLVGGSRDTRTGWLLPLPAALHDLTVVMRWSVPLEVGAAPQEVEHHLTLRLRGNYTGANAGKCAVAYSTKPQYWRSAGNTRHQREPLAPLHLMPYATLGAEGIQSARLARLGTESTAQCACLHETIVVPPVALTTLWNLKALRQTVDFDT